MAEPFPTRTSALLTRLLTLFVLATASWAGADAEDDFELARNLFRDAGDYATSAQLFADFLRNYPTDSRIPDARLMLARSYARSQRCDEAVPAFEAFYERHIDHLAVFEARQERAACLQATGQYGRAAVGYEEVQRLNSEAQYAASSLLSAAGNYARAGDLGNAVRAYDKLLSEYGRSAEARRGRYRLAQLRFAGGDPATAQALLTQITDSAPRSDAARDALLLSGNIHLVLQRPGPAEAAFRRLHEGFAGSAASDSARLDLAAFYLAQQQLDEAIAQYEKAAAAIKDPDLLARARLGRADALRLAGRTDDALQQYEALLRDDSQVVGQARLGQAISLGQLDRVGAAVGIFLQLAQTPAGSVPSAVAAGAVRELGALYRRQGDLTRAGSWFRRYLDEAERYGDQFPEPQSEQDRARLQLAQVLGSSGYHDEAVRLFGQLSRGRGPLAGEAQYGLAAAYDGSGARRLAIGEYSAFLERWPGHARAGQVRQRIEYLREYTIVDPQQLSRALQEAWVDELAGTSRQGTRLRVARVLREHQDYVNGARAWETYVASYPGDSSTPEAQFYLADCLYRLSRQRQLEGAAGAADSLHALALQEDRILADADAGRWSRLARLRMIESSAAATTAAQRLQVLDEGYSAFLEEHPLADETREARARALLGLADARRQASQQDSSQVARSDEAYAQLLREAADSPHAARARYGRAVLAMGRTDGGAAIDSLSALLPSLSGTQLQADVLAALGQALADAGRYAEAATRLGELLLAFPDTAHRRQAQEELADAYIALGDADRAAELYESLAASDPDGDADGSLRLRLGRAWQQQGRAQEALALYERLLDIGAGPTDSLQLTRGRLLAGLGRRNEAVAALNQIRSGPLLPAARLSAADLHFAAGDFSAATAAYAPLLKDDSIDADALGRAAAALYELGRRDEANKLASRHRKRFGKQGVWPYLLRLYEGRYYLARDEYDKAIDLFEDVAKDAAKEPATATMSAGTPVTLRRMAADPASAGAFFAVTARWEQMRAEPTEEGTAQAVQAQSNFAKNFPQSPFAGDVYMRLAEFQAALNNLRPAAGAYRRVVDHPQATLDQRQQAIWQLLRCYTRLSEWDEALRIARRIGAEFPEHPNGTDVQLEIGYILAQMGQHAQAIAYLENVLEWAEGEDAAEARFYIGRAYQNMGDYRKAIQTFYQVSFYGADANIQWITTADFERASCYEELGESAQARSVYERILQREGGDSEFGRIARQHIQQLSSR